MLCPAMFLQYELQTYPKGHNSSDVPAIYPCIYVCLGTGQLTALRRDSQIYTVVIGRRWEWPLVAAPELYA